MARSRKLRRLSAGDKPASGVPRWIASRYDVTMGVVWLLVWILPICWVGSMRKDIRFGKFEHKPWVKEYHLRDAFKFMRHQQRVACLFINSVNTWKTYHPQYQMPGSDKWVELQHKEFSEQTVFGFRTRLHRFLGQAYKKSRGSLRLQHIAQFMRDRYRERHPDEEPFAALRFVSYGQSSSYLAKKWGVYRRPILPRRCGVSKERTSAESPVERTTKGGRYKISMVSLPSADDELLPGSWMARVRHAKSGEPLVGAKVEVVPSTPLYELHTANKKLKRYQTTPYKGPECQGCYQLDDFSEKYGDVWGARVVIKVPDEGASDVVADEGNLAYCNKRWGYFGERRWDGKRATHAGNGKTKKKSRRKRGTKTRPGRLQKKGTR